MNNSNDRSSGAQVSGLWTVGEVAAYLNVSRSWVYHQAASGQLPSLHLGPLVRFDPEAVRAFAHGELARRGRVIAFRPAVRGGDNDSSK